MRIDRKKLVCAMMDADLNTKQLAEKAGLSRATVCSVKNGKSCSGDTLDKIAEALQIKKSKLLED